MILALLGEASKWAFDWGQSDSQLGCFVDELARANPVPLGDAGGERTHDSAPCRSFDDDDDNDDAVRCVGRKVGIPSAWVGATGLCEESLTGRGGGRMATFPAGPPRGSGWYSRPIRRDG